jgi:hypothetical protein
MVAYAYYSIYKRSINRRITVQAGLGKNMRPYLKTKQKKTKTQSKEGLRVWLKQ